MPEPGSDYTLGLADALARISGPDGVVLRHGTLDAKLTAPAGHRLEDFTDDLLAWRIFFGPQGGEVAAQS